VTMRLPAASFSRTFRFMAICVALASCSGATPGNAITGDMTTASPTSASPLHTSSEDLTTNEALVPDVTPTSPVGRPYERLLYSAGRSGVWTLDQSLKPFRVGPAMAVLGTHISAEDFGRPTPGLLSPSERYLAAYSADSPNTWCHSLHLVILDLSTGTLAASIPLTPQDSKPTSEPTTEYSCYALDEQNAALTIIMWPPSLAWSNHGDKLAFVGAQEGPTADLYVLDIATGSVARLTSGPTHATRPIWSPSDDVVLSASIDEMTDYGVMGGPFPAWGPILATHVATATSSLLYSSSEFDSLPEAFLSWISPTEYLADSDDHGCGFKDLRSVDIASGETTTIWAPEYLHRAYASELSAVLVSVPAEDPTGGHCLYTEDPGLYIVNIHSGEARPISSEASDAAWWGSVVWSPQAYRFFVSSPRGVISLGPDGSVEAIGPREATELFVAASGTTLALAPIYNPGLLILTSDGEPIAAHAVRAYAIVLSPSGQEIAYFADDIFYVARAPSYSAIPYDPVEPDSRPVLGDEVLWLSPQ